MRRSRARRTSRRPWTQLGLVVETGIAGMATAFRATLRGELPGRTVGLVANYDAVPSVPNAGGLEAIHACGHGPISAGVVAAVAALAAERHRLRGSVVVMGCPADELLMPRGRWHVAVARRSAPLPVPGRHRRRAVRPPGVPGDPRGRSRRGCAGTRRGSTAAGPWSPGRRRTWSRRSEHWSLRPPRHLLPRRCSSRWSWTATWRRALASRGTRPLPPLGAR